MNQTTVQRRTNGRLDTSKLEERKRRRKRQRLRRKIEAAAVTAVLCVLSFVAGRCTAPGQNSVYGKTELSEASAPGKAGVKTGNAPGVKGEESSISDEEKYNYIKAHRQEYPAYLLDFLEKTPEAVDFVYGYPEYVKKGQAEDFKIEYTEGEIPLFLQWDKRWGYREYGDDIVALSGCGPTCLSMVYVGLTGDVSMNPGEMALFSEKNGYYLEGIGTSWDLMGAGAEALGLQYETIPLNKKAIYEELDKGHPLICSMRPGDFTESGHFIVIYGRKGDELFVHDPNSPERSQKKWSYSSIENQIKNVWSYG